MLLNVFILAAVLVVLLLVLPNVRNSMKQQTQNYLYDITVSSGDMLSLVAAGSSVEETLQTDVLSQLIGDVGIKGVESSYAYVVRLTKRMDERFEKVEQRFEKMEQHLETVQHDVNACKLEKDTISILIKKSEQLEKRIEELERKTA